jgi:hypothetical protein
VLSFIDGLRNQPSGIAASRLRTTPQCRRNDDCRNDDNDRCRAKACSSPFVILIFCLMAQEELEDLICLAEVWKPSA